MLFTWGQTMVEVMEIVVTSFKRSHASTATLSAPDPAAGHSRPTLLPDPPGHSQASLGQSLGDSLLLSPGSFCAQDTPGEMLGWMRHKLESRLSGEISTTSDMQMTPPLWQK